MKRLKSLSDSSGPGPTSSDCRVVVANPAGDSSRRVTRKVVTRPSMTDTLTNPWMILSRWHEVSPTTDTYRATRSTSVNVRRSSRAHMERGQGASSLRRLVRRETCLETCTAHTWRTNNRICSLLQACKCSAALPGPLSTPSSVNETGSGTYDRQEAVLKAESA